MKVSLHKVDSIPDRESEEKKMKKCKRISIIVMLCLLITMIAVPATASAASINKKSITLNVGKKYTLKVKGTKKRIIWSSNKKSVVTVSSKGVVKAVKKGNAVITAKYGKRKLTCKVTVKQPVTRIILNKNSIKLKSKETYTLKAKVAPGNANNKAIAWKSSNTKIATVSSKGVVKAIKSGTVTITATAKDGSGKKVACKVYVMKESGNAYTKLKNYAMKNGRYFTFMGKSGYEVNEDIEDRNSIFSFEISFRVYTSHPIIEFIYTGEWGEEGKNARCTITDCMTHNANGTYGKAELNYFYYASCEDGASTRVNAVNKTTGYNYQIGRSLNGAQDFIFEEDNKGLKNNGVFVAEMVDTVDEMFEYSNVYILSKAGVSFKDLGFKNLNLSI